MDMKGMCLWIYIDVAREEKIKIDIYFRNARISQLFIFEDSNYGNWLHAFEWKREREGK